MRLLVQEMLALGCSNFLGSFFKIHVICCALSVTLAVDSAGGTSQVSVALPRKKSRSYLYQAKYLLIKFCIIGLTWQVVFKNVKKHSKSTKI